MNIILPIVIAAVAMGLLVRRMTAGHWIAMSVWITLVIGYFYVKH